MSLGPTLGSLDGEHGFSALGVDAVLDVGFKGKTYVELFQGSGMIAECLYRN